MSERKKEDDKKEKAQIERAKRNPKAFAPLYEKYYKQIFLYSKKKIGSQEDSEDITAAVFEKALNNLKKFQWQGIPLSAWLYRIARNEINDYLRRKLVKKEDPGSEEKLEMITEDVDSQLDILIRDELHQKVLHSIGKLKKVDQFIVYYKFFEELGNKKIARILKMTETNVGTRLHRLKAILKKEINAI